MKVEFYLVSVFSEIDAWMITPGFKTGVVQLVGEAIHDHKVTNPGSHITAIGCSKWGATRNREALIIVSRPMEIIRERQGEFLVGKFHEKSASGWTKN